MIQKISKRITQHMQKKGWISDEDAIWSIYVLEKRLSITVYVCFVLAYSFLINKPVEVSAFVITSFLLRRRMGGWHAPSHVLCQLISILIVVVVTTLAHYLCLNNIILRSLSVMIITILLLITKPIYPLNAEFSPEVVIANNARKNHIVLILFLVQIITVVLNLASILFFILSAEYTVYLAAVIEFIKQNRKECKL